MTAVVERHGSPCRTTRWAAGVAAALVVVAAACSAGSEDADDTTADGTTSASGDTAPAPTTVADADEPVAPTDHGTSAAPSSSTTSTSTSQTDSTTTTVARLAPTPEVIGPIADTPATAMPQALADDNGYVEEEYFLRGSANAYAPTGELGADGAWSVEPTGSESYATRVLVRRPTTGFNGTVYVEWFNVTVGVDGDPDFGLVHPVIFDERAAYVGVSAQAVAVVGGDDALLPIDLGEPLAVADPERYGELAHPGDAYSYDIFAQVASAIRDGPLLAGDEATTVIAIGESQSAGRLVTFVNAIQPITNAYDGFLVHSRAGGHAPLGDDEDATVTFVDGATQIRADTDVPVFQVETETDVGALGFVAARQPDTDRITTWEIAGAAHADASLLAYGSEDASAAGLASLCGDINDGPQAQVVRAALSALGAWVRDDVQPPVGSPLEFTDGSIVRDFDGNALGGVRTPDVDAPIAAHSGEPSSDNPLCFLFGSTTPFTEERLAELYPTRDDYVAAVRESADAALEAGHILPAARDSFMAEAEAASIPG